MFPPPRMKERPFVSVVKLPVQADEPFLLDPIEELSIPARRRLIEQPRVVEVTTHDEREGDSTLQKMEHDIEQPHVSLEL